MLFVRQSRTKQDLEKHILGVINRTDTGSPRVNELRTARRFLRSVPVVLAPWVESRPVPEDHTFALTRDMSFGGAGLILQQPYRADEVVIGIRPTPSKKHEPLRSPQFFVGSIISNTVIGGGFWLMGIQLTESVTPDHSLEFRQLQEFAVRLTPPVVAHASEEETRLKWMAAQSARSASEESALPANSIPFEE